MIKHKAAAVFLAMYLVLGSWKGYVALFRPGESEPWQIFPTRIEALPEADRTALDRGIPVRNHRDLERLLEDYLS